MLLKKYQTGGKAKKKSWWDKSTRDERFLKRQREKYPDIYAEDEALSAHWKKQKAKLKKHMGKGEKDPSSRKLSDDKYTAKLKEEVRALGGRLHGRKNVTSEGATYLTPEFKGKTKEKYGMSPEEFYAKYMDYDKGGKVLKKYKEGGKVKKGKKEEVPYYSTMRELALGVYKKQMEGKPLVGDEEKEYSKSGSYRAFQTTKPWDEIGHLKVTGQTGDAPKLKKIDKEFGRSAGASPLAKAKAHIKKKRKGGKKKKKTTDMPHGAMMMKQGFKGKVYKSNYKPMEPVKLLKKKEIA
jgi:hypothetical protein